MQNSTHLSLYDNKSYSAGRSLIIRAMWFMVSALFFLNPFNPSSLIKVMLLRLFGAQIGKGVTIKPSVNIKYPWLLKIGDHCWIGEKVWIDNLVQVTLGSNVCLSQGALLLTGNHNYKKSTFELITGEIKLEDGVWIGAQATVCPGILCGSHAMLKVKSVATSDLEPWGIYQGNPALKVAKRSIEE